MCLSATTIHHINFLKSMTKTFTTNIFPFNHIQMNRIILYYFLFYTTPSGTGNAFIELPTRNLQSAFLCEGAVPVIVKWS